MRFKSVRLLGSSFWKTARHSFVLGRPLCLERSARLRQAGNMLEEKMHIGTWLRVRLALVLWATVAAAPDQGRVTREIQTVPPAAARAGGNPPH